MRFFLFSARQASPSVGNQTNWGIKLACPQSINFITLNAGQRSDDLEDTNALRNIRASGLAQK